MTKQLAIAAFALLLSLVLFAPVSQAGDLPADNKQVDDKAGDDKAEKPAEEPADGTPVDVAIPNASFEQGTDVPEKWTTHSGEVSGAYGWDTSVQTDGKKSISTSGTRWGYGRWSSAILSIPTDGYQWHSLSGQVKSTGNNGEVYIAIAWYDANLGLITTSDSAMLGDGDNDWSTLTVNALPPANAAYFAAWCISNHNDGVTWFDGLGLRRTKFAAAGAKTYAQFIIDQPAHPLAVEANVMQVKQLITAAKWTAEEDYYDSAKQLAAAALYGKAAAATRVDAVYQAVFAALHDNVKERDTAVKDAQTRFDKLIDDALFNAIQTAKAGGDTTAADKYEALLQKRKKTVPVRGVDLPGN